MRESLYNQLGGEEAIETVTTNLFDRVLDDKQLASYFQDIEMDAHKRQLAAFISMVAGGPDEYRGQSMQKAHAHLGISATEFESLAGHLEAALDEVGVPDESKDELLASVGEIQDHIVSD